MEGAVAGAGEARKQVCAAPTVRSQHGPDRLGLWSNALPHHEMARITSALVVCAVWHARCPAGPAGLTAACPPTRPPRRQMRATRQPPQVSASPTKEMMQPPVSSTGAPSLWLRASSPT